MKAKDWVMRFKENFDEACDSFKEETQRLVELRTKKSKKGYDKAAKEGALREQRDKWRAIAYWIPNMDANGFEAMLNPPASVSEPKQERAGAGGGAETLANVPPAERAALYNDGEGKSYVVTDRETQ